MKLGTILVATDFSDAAALAVNQAGDIAKRAGARLILLRVDSRLAAGRGRSGVSQPGSDSAGDERAAEHMQRLEEIGAPFLQSGLRVEYEVRGGHPDEVIVEAADDFAADLVVTGTRGRTGLKRFLLGSVAEKVVRLASTNVMVARLCPSAVGTFQRIMVPTDFSPASEKALRLALMLAPEGASIDLFHAWQFPPGTHIVGTPDDKNSPLAGMRRDILKAAQKSADAWISKYENRGVPLSFLHGYGPAAGVIQEQVVQQQYDLVAMGTHGYRGFRRFVLGSVAEAIVRYSPCSVMIAHAENVDRTR